MTHISSTLAYTSVSEGLTVEHHHSRETFAAQRKAGLTAQRHGVQTRLANLRTEVHKIQVRTSTLTDETALRETITKLERMALAERKLVDDITRLTDKIGN